MPVNFELRVDEGETELTAVAARVREALLDHFHQIVTVVCQNERQADEISSFLAASELERVQYVWSVQDPPKRQPGTQY